MAVPWLYIDTRGASRDFTRSAPCGARVAFHTDEGVIEFAADMNGRWTVKHGPRLNEAGVYEIQAQGTVADGGP